MKNANWLSPIVLGVIGFLNMQPSHAIALNLAPSSATVSIGDPVDVNVIISGLGNGVPPSVGAYNLDVSFDPLVLKPVSVDFGTLLGDPLSLEVLTDFNFSTPGIVDFAAVSLLPPADLDVRQPSSFTLATLSFTTIASGTSQFAFVGDIRVDDAFGNTLPIPEPTTLALFVGGLMGLELIMRWRRKGGKG